MATTVVVTTMSDPPLCCPAPMTGTTGKRTCTEGLDVVTDFRQGTDHLALAGGLRFDQRAFKYDAACRGTLLFVISAHDHDDAAMTSSATTVMIMAVAAWPSWRASPARSASRISSPTTIWGRWLWWPEWMTSLRQGAPGGAPWPVQ